MIRAAIDAGLSYSAQPSSEAATVREGHGNLVICVPHGVWDCPKCDAARTDEGRVK